MSIEIIQKSSKKKKSYHHLRGVSDDFQLKVPNIAKMDTLQDFLS